MRIFFLSMLVLLSTELFSSEYGQNIREICRIEASGYYINLYHQIQNSEASVQVWSQKLKKLAKVIKTTKNELSKMERLAAGQFDRLLEERVVGLEHRLRVLKAEQDQGEATVALERKRLVKTKSKLRLFEAEIKNVFQLKKLPVADSKLLTYRLDYLHSCSKFQIICPLPSQQRQELKKIANRLEQGLSCQRYAQVLPVK